MSINRIKKLRIDRGLTIRKLSEITRIPASTLSGYEKPATDKSHRNPKLENLEKLASFFDVSVSYLKGETNSPNVEKVTLKKYDGKPLLIETGNLTAASKALLANLAKEINDFAKISIESDNTFDKGVKAAWLLTLVNEMKKVNGYILDGNIKQAYAAHDMVDYIINNPEVNLDFLMENGSTIDMDTMRPQD